MNENSPDAEAGVEAGPAVAPGVEVIYFTDPLCPWSWAFEPQWRRLLNVYGGQITVRLAMGGMIADWKSFHDPIHSIHNPSQMAAQWYEVRRTTAVPVDERIWHDDPPGSSYPACLAVKAAEQQGAEAGAAYLRLVREAVMAGRRNVARGEVLADLADALAADPPPGVVFDAGQFRVDLVGAGARDAFHDDIREVRYRNIARFPTLVLRADAGAGIAVVGYRPFAILAAALTQLAPELRPGEDLPGAVAYVRRWKRAMAWEAAAALGIDAATALRSLENAVATGELDRDDSIAGGFLATDAQPISCR